jgi:hypothetical protein
MQSGIVSSHDLSEAIQLSKRLQVPVTRSLLDHGCIDERILEMANDLQLLVKDNLVAPDAAMISLRRLAAKEASPDELLDEIYSLPRFGQNAKTMVELLKRSGIVPEERLNQSMRLSKQSGASFKRTLILDGILSAGFFPAIARMQERCRQGKLTIDQAAEQLKTEYGFFMKAEQSQRSAVLQAEGLPAHAAKPARSDGHFDHSYNAIPSIAQLIEASGFVGQREIEQTYEKLLANPHLSAKVFEKMGLVKSEALTDVLKCQELIRKGELSAKDGIRALKICRNKKIGLRRALEEISGWSIFEARKERRNGMIFGFLTACLVGVAWAGIPILVGKLVLRPASGTDEEPTSDVD